MSTTSTAMDATVPASGSGFLTRMLTAVVRILMGLMFFVFGLNGFLHFIPQPKNAMSQGAAALFGAYVASGYMIPLIFATQTAVGALLLVNRFVPLALAVIAPVIVHIVMFHIFLAPSGLGMASVVAAMELYLAFAYRRSFAPMLAMRAKP